ncbi:hypothetical protein C6N75_04605 [Streptomyces solincola]|uniref:Major facilitator superfamily (MFS) profile domain-containing protein n=1 Tax=Streptomyces solincola TaxID=2100817 RepID=A0A2S9Q118_9ACTN|nr:sugar porter family MFS transporter [Streptomyces solincola]PRH80374.1 hypothetical protein C6N75_04605 [Streptomyces solincola]
MAALNAPDVPTYLPPRELRTKLVAVAASTGALFGFSIAAVNQTLEQIRAEFGLSSLDKGIVVSSLVVGALAGCVCASALTDRLGQRLILCWAGVLGTAASVVGAVSPDEAVLSLARFLVGFAVGVTSAVSPMLLAELATAHRRGSLVTLYQLSLTVGVLIALVLGLVASAQGEWRLMFAANGVPALVQAVAVLLLPPAPGDLVARGRQQDAMAVLRATRGPVEAAQVLEDFGAFQSSRAGSLLRGLVRPETRVPVAIALGAALMNALVGIGAVVYYSTLVFASAGVGGQLGAEVATLSIGVMNVVASVAALTLISRFGRRPLLAVGLSGISGSLCVAAFGLIAGGGSVSGPLTIGAVLVFIACFAFSAGPLAWLIMAEVTPREIRAGVAGTALALNWAANLLVALLFPVIVGTPGSPTRVGVVFLVFAAFSVVFLVAFRRYVPETKDRSLAELQNAFRERGGRSTGPS